MSGGRPHKNKQISFVAEHKRCIDRVQVELDTKSEDFQLPRHNLISIRQDKDGQRMEMASKISRKLIFSRNEPNRQLWDYFIMLVATYNVMVLPVEISFDHEVFQTTAYKFLSALTDVLFFLDILVVFRTTIVYEEDECDDPKTIAIEYLKSRFLIDFFSTVPFDVVFAFALDDASKSTLKLTSTLKLVRILRLSHIIKTMNIAKYQKTYFKIYLIMLYLILYAHITACCWYSLTLVAATWDHPSRKGVPVDPTNFFEKSFFFRYFISFYTATLYLLGNDQFAGTTNEVQLGIALKVAGAFIQGHLIGELTELVD